jgi:hypothetical protein
LIPPELWTNFMRSTEPMEGTLQAG